MRILITGATGFVGAYLVGRLREDHELVVTDRDPDLPFLEAIAGPGVGPVFALDVLDQQRLGEIIADHEPEAIVHLAAPLTAPSEANIRSAVEIHCLGTDNVLEAAKAGKVRRVVVASSVAVYGDQNNRGSRPIRNDDFHSPNSVYGMCKMIGERMVAAARSELETIALRLTAVYGYGKHVTVGRGTGGSFLIDLIDRPALGESTSVPYGDSLVDWVHAADVADAFAAVLEMERLPASVGVNIAGEVATVREVASMMMSLLDGVTIDVAPGTWPHNLAMRFDLDETEAAIGYRPRLGLEAGLRKTIADVRAHAIGPLA